VCGHGDQVVYLKTPQRAERLVLNEKAMKGFSTAQRSVRAFAAAMFLTGAGGCVFARPARTFVGSAPTSLGAQTVAFPSRSGSVIRAWLAPGKRGAGAVLLLHGMGGNRSSMLGRAAFLHRAGFTVLAPDFQAHGESPGQHITFGELESLDAEAALAFLRSRAPGERVGIIGVSMGGAATLVGSKPLRADALVLESVYPTFRDAVADRLRSWLGPVGFLGNAVTPALIQLVAPRIGVDPSKLRPIDDIEKVGEPLLLIAGTEDHYTRLSESRALFARATSPKELWEVRGAGHEDLHEYAPLEYERRVGAFLVAHLRASTLTTEASAIDHDSPEACRIESVARRDCK
jgi:alpha-beta hydrolase superfamily lysophospholipase